MFIILFFIAHWYLSLFTQSFYHHRYAAHKMFSMSRGWEKFFHFLSYVLQGSSYLTPRAYAILHRMHHAYSDTEKDPHSPHFSGNVFLMMWKTRTKYKSALKNRESSFGKNLPEWTLIDKLGENVFSRIGWGALYVGFYVLFATEWYYFLLLPVHFLMGPVHGAIVNWFGHKLGYSNFENGDQSKNTLLVDFLMLGELYQNNHHKFASSPNFAKKWYEFDPLYPVIRFFDLLGVVKLSKGGKGVQGDEMLSGS